MTYSQLAQLYIFESTIDSMSHASIENVITGNPAAWLQLNRINQFIRDQSSWRCPGWSLILQSIEAVFGIAAKPTVKSFTTDGAFERYFSCTSHPCQEGAICVFFLAKTQQVKLFLTLLGFSVLYFFNSTIYMLIQVNINLKDVRFSRRQIF